MWRDKKFRAEKFRMGLKRYMLVEGKLIPILKE